MSIAYRKVEGRVDTVVAFFPDKAEPIREADSNHPHWTAILEGLEAGDDDVYELFNVARGLTAKLRKLSERVDFNGQDVLFDGDTVDDALSQQIRRFLEAGVDNYQPLVNFWENIAQNPSEHSRENLYRWLRTHEFSITPEGYIVGYKGVQVYDNNEYKSIHSGPAVVDGVSVNGFVPNQPGSVVSMARSAVTEDPSIGCHVGLHVGTWDYANGFARGAVLEVHVHPRDVVSVPTECGDAKMRVSKYTVVDVVGGKYDDAVVYRGTEDYVDEDEWQGDVGYNTW